MYKVTIFLAAAVLAGCYTTKDIPAGQFQKIQRGAHAGELILRTEKGKPVRFGPRSKIRFQLDPRRWSNWYRGHQLRVNRVGVCVEKGCTPPRKGWRWDDIRSAQVKNLSGGKTYAAVFITVAVAAATVAVIAAMAGGKGGGGSLKLGGLFRRGGGGRVFRGGGRVSGRVGRVGGGAGRISGLRPRGGARVGGLRPRGGGRVGGLRPRGPRSHGVRPGRRGTHRHGRPPHHARSWSSQGSLSDLPPPEPDPDTRDTRDTRSATSTAKPAPPDLDRPSGTPTHPLRLTLHGKAGTTSSIFTRPTHRRANIRFIGLVEGGADLLIRDGGSAQALVGMRILDVLELAAGAHMLVHRGESDASTQRTSWIGIFRLNLHFDLDARRRVALPIGFDLGAGHATFYARLNLGVRVRLTRRLSIGIYPFNPTYAEFKDTNLRRKTGWWSFPSTIDLSFAL